MGLWRSSCPTVCPVCDAAIDPKVADAPEPVCPECAFSLRPVLVAGLWRRTAAGLLDALVVLATAGLLNLLLLMWLDPPPLLGDAKGIDAMLRVLDVVYGEHATVLPRGRLPWFKGDLWLEALPPPPPRA